MHAEGKKSADNLMEIWGRHCIKKPEENAVAISCKNVCDMLFKTNMASAKRLDESNCGDSPDGDTRHPIKSLSKSSLPA
jgi:hypothetical protein